MSKILIQSLNNRKFIKWHSTIRLTLDTINIPYEEIVEEHYEAQESYINFLVKKDDLSLAKEVLMVVVKETQCLEDLTPQYLGRLKVRFSKTILSKVLYGQIS